MIAALGVGCGPDDAGDDGAMDDETSDGETTDASDGPEPPGDPDSTSDGGPPMVPEVPSSEYCAGVANWDMGHSAFEQEVLVLVNEARAQGANCGGEMFGSTGPLQMEARLRCAARVHSVDMATRGFFDHTNPDGESPFDRMEKAGYGFAFAGENIAAGQMTPADVVVGWLESPGHCRNIMSPDFRELGVGYALFPQDQYRHYWTQVFGTPG